MIDNNKELSDMVRSVSGCMTWCGELSNHIWGAGYKDAHVHMGIGRAQAQIKASIDLIFLGYYAESGSVLRNAFEMITVLSCVIKDPLLLQKWKNATKKDYSKGGDFQPFKMRKLASAALNVRKDLLDACYHNLCKVCTHPDNDGIFFFETKLTIGALHRCDPDQCKSLLEEILVQAYLLVRGMEPLRPSSFSGSQHAVDGFTFVEKLLEEKRRKGEFIGIAGLNNPRFITKNLP